MRDCQVRAVFLGMILAFPVLLGMASRSAVGPVVGVEGLVVLGLLHAAGARRRLIEAATPRPVTVVRPRAQTRRRATVQA